MKKILFLILITLAFNQTSVVHAQHDGDELKNFSCTWSDGLFGLGKGWTCDVAIYDLEGCSQPEAVFFNTTSGYRTSCGPDISPLLNFTYCRGGGEVSRAVSCGPDQKALDSALVQNLADKATAGKMTCVDDPSYPGGRKVMCAPANVNVAGCVPSRYGGYVICDQYPSECGQLPASTNSTTCDLPKNTEKTVENTPTKDRTLSYQPLEPLPGFEEMQDLNFAQFLTTVFKILISIGAILSVVTLVYAGVSYILSEAFETKGEAKNRMKAALFGMIILVGAWLLLNTINPALLNFDLGSIGTKQGTTPQDLGNGSSNTQNQINIAEKNACESPTNPGKYEPKPGGGYTCKR